MKAKEKKEMEAKKQLLESIEPGDVIYTTLRHVSRSGMYRVIGMYVIKENTPLWISGYASYLLEGYDKRHDGCKAHGVGMDMGFHLVYELAYALFGEGYALKQRWM